MEKEKNKWNQQRHKELLLTRFQAAVQELGCKAEFTAFPYSFSEKSIMPSVRCL